MLPRLDKERQEYEGGGNEGKSLAKQKFQYKLDGPCEGFYVTQREAESLFYIIHGYTIKEVAKALSLVSKNNRILFKQSKIKI